MKVLDVKELQDGIDQFIREIDASFERISRVQRAVRDFHALDDALKGEGGDALRNFFNDCHQPFLVYLFQSLIDFKHALEKIKEATQSYESHHNGFISEEFLQNDVEAGLDKVAETTIDLTDEANSIITSVQDIVAIEKIDETEVLDNVQRGKGKSREIIEDLYHLDDYGTSLLEKTKEDLESMSAYISELESKFTSGDLSVKNYNVKAIKDLESRQTIVESITNKVEEFDKIEASPVYQQILEQNEMTPEELAAIKAYLEREGYKGEKYSVEAHQTQGYGPITYWDRVKVMGGGPSSLSGSPDGLAGIATSGFDFFTDDIVTAFHPESTVSERMLAGLFSFPAFKPAKFLKPMDDVVGGVGKVGKGKGKHLLPTEGKVGTFKELTKQGTAFDNITPHHMPSAAKMKQAGVKRNEGVSMNMEQPHPGVGGRHRETYTYGLSGNKLEEYLNLSYRDALAHDILDARRIYMKDGVYTPEIRTGLLNTIRKSRELYPELFNK